MRRARLGLASASLVSLIALPLTLAAPVAAADPVGPDVCLAVHLERLPAEAWPAVIEAVDAATATDARPQLFPRRAREVLLGADEAPAIIAIWAAGRAPDAAASCPALDADWTATIGRPFLSDGADRLLAAAPTTPGIESDVVVEWYPDEGRVRTWLEFRGPLDIPNGTCWIDDVLGVTEGAATTTAERGLRTSPFAESACGRFFDYLALGGAGEQAVTLLPSRVSLPDGSEVVFITDRVDVAADAIVLSGSIARG